MNQPQPLTLEQEFELRLFADHVQQFSPEEAQALLVDLYRNTMVLENLFRQIVQDSWEGDLERQETLEFGPESLSF